MSLGPDERRTERYHPRIQAQLSVKLEWRGQTRTAKARDLSMAGLFIEGIGLLPGERLTLSMLLPDRQLLTDAVVKRRTREGVAVEFQDLDWDDMLALARFLHPRLP